MSRRQQAKTVHRMLRALPPTHTRRKPKKRGYGQPIMAWRPASVTFSFDSSGEVTAMGRGVRDDQSRTHRATSRASGMSFGLEAGERLPNVQTGAKERGGESGFPAGPSLSPPDDQEARP